MIKDLFVCPYCHQKMRWVLRKAGNIGYMCDTCNLFYKFSDGLYYFFDENAEHWQQAWKGVKASKKVGEELYFGHFAPSTVGFPYVALNKDAHIGIRSNALLFNIALEFLHPCIHNGSGYILDIGAYTGWESYLLARYMTTIAIDVSDYALWTINSFFGKGIFKVVGDGCYLPFPDDFVDAIFMCATYHHMPNRLQALNEWYRILKPAARLVAVGETYVPKEDLMDQKMIDSGEYGYTREEMMETFEKCAFKNIVYKRAKYSDNMEYKGMEEIIEPINAVQEGLSLPLLSSFEGIPSNGIIFAIKD